MIEEVRAIQKSAEVHLYRPLSCLHIVILHVFTHSVLKTSNEIGIVIIIPYFNGGETEAQSRQTGVVTMSEMVKQSRGYRVGKGIPSREISGSKA